MGEVLIFKQKKRVISEAGGKVVKEQKTILN